MALLHRISPTLLFLPLFACDPDSPTLDQNSDRAEVVEGTDNTVGSACDVGFGVFGVGVSDAACESGICLNARAALEEEQSCTKDADCNVAGADDYECVGADVSNEGYCRANQARREADTMCSAFCASDVDCAASTNSQCLTGFSCLPSDPFLLPGCAPVCVCNDLVPPETRQQLKANFEGATNTDEDCAL